MKKKWISFLLVVYYISIFQKSYSQADGLYYSPYSYFGLGDKAYNNSLRNRAMGSIGIANSSPINIISDNPASYADLKQTTFEFSASYKNSYFITDSIRISRTNIAFDGIHFAFPSNKKFTLVLGMLPTTKSGYKVKQISDLIHDSDTLKLLTIRSGDGGINQATLGVGIPFFKYKLNIGINANYYFGVISRYKETAYLSNGFINTLVRNRTNYKGWGYQLGIIYSDSIGSYKGRIGISYQTSLNLKTQQNFEYFDAIPTPLGIAYNAFDTSSTFHSSLSIPSVLSLGIGMDNFNKLTWGIDLQYYDGSKNVFQEPNTIFQKSYKIRLGLEWVPKFSEESYWKKVAYRFGGYYHQSELKLFGHNINQMAITWGLGFPFRRTLSRFNLYFEIGQRGIRSENLVKELYWSSGIGVTFNETWFIKRKLD